MMSEKQPTPYELLGGESGVRALVDRFYDLMDQLQETQDIRRLHPADLSGSREKLFLFLSGWFGGPGRYVERYGHPMLRARHLSFTIGERERDQWMLCMGRALAEQELEQQAHEQLMQAFMRTADHMRNREE
ncbi:MAG: group II truncated hemoglobin [Acidiferrobacteraceae bacterium]|jgi:hemoglobin